MWYEVQPPVFSSRGKAVSLNIIVDSCLAEVVILSTFSRLSLGRSLRDLRSSFCKKPVVLVFLSVSLRPQVSQAALLLTAPSKLCRMLNPMPHKLILKLVVYRPFS